jgi:hypothetical protein
MFSVVIELQLANAAIQRVMPFGTEKLVSPEQFMNA